VEYLFHGAGVGVNVGLADFGEASTVRASTELSRVSSAEPLSRAVGLVVGVAVGVGVDVGVLVGVDVGVVMVVGVDVGVLVQDFGEASTVRASTELSRMSSAEPLSRAVGVGVGVPKTAR